MNIDIENPNCDISKIFLEFKHHIDHITYPFKYSQHGTFYLYEIEQWLEVFLEKELNDKEEENVNVIIDIWIKLEWIKKHPLGNLWTINPLTTKEESK